MSMKYVVVRDSPNSPKMLYIFPMVINHKDFASQVMRPGGEVVSAGSLADYCESFKMQGHDREEKFDQIRLQGESVTLKCRSLPEDLELFRREASGY